MPVAILTKFLGPTNKLPCRMKAWTCNGQSLVVSKYAIETDSDNDYAVHLKTARKLADKMGWKGELIGGGTKDGMAFVFKP